VELLLDRSRFEYNAEAPFEVRLAGIREKDGVQVRNFTYLDPDGTRRAAYLVRPEGGKGLAAVLFVHWYEPEAPDSNRGQFLEEANKLARKGVVSLLVETMWSDPDWFLKRSQEEDIAASIAQVVSLRRAMDLLLSEPGVDPDRLLYVGHDFGGMYGVLMGAVDPRPGAYLLMAATPRFPDWYLYYPPLEGELREAFMQSFIPFDPITNIHRLAPAPVLFQFATEDPHVSKDRAEGFFAAAGEPKEIRWYQTGHGLNQLAAADRLDWIGNQLKLT
jgi:dienelactone hydrolase